MVRRLEALFAAVAIVAGLSSIGLAYYDAHRPAYVAPIPTTDVVVSAVPTPTEVPASPTPTPQPTPLPASLRIDGVPYTVQAPFGNWDQPHEEYCEAAAVLMVGRYYKGNRYPPNNVIPPSDADQAMGQIVAWERQQWPGVTDLSLDKVGQVGNQFYNLHPNIQEATLDNIKAQLAAGHPVIIPVATHGAPGGRPISPYYSSGNVYHVIVLVGYDGGFVFANDAGISQGQNYKYDWANTLLPAIDAQTTLHPAQSQGRVMLYFTPAQS